MRITIDGIGELRFRFEHKPSGTLVYCDTQTPTVHSASASLAKGDQFVKAIGRRVALTKMLKYGLCTLVNCEPTLLHPSLQAKWVTHHVFTRDQRRQIWAEYFRRHADLRRKEVAIA